MYKKIFSPILVQWEITGYCNHRCVYCYNFWREDQNIDLLPPNYESLFERTASELIQNKVFSVVITGGEPLSVIDKVAKYIKRLADSGIWLSMNSNLALLTPEKAKIVKECGIKSILFSIPSANPKTFEEITNVKGSFDRMLKGVKIAQEFGFNLYANMVISKYNLHELDMTAAYVKSLGVNHICATKVSDPSSHDEFKPYLLSIEEYRKMRRDLDNIGKKYNMTTDSLQANPICSYGGYEPKAGFRNCNAGKTTIAIGAEGQIRPCIMLPIVYGNMMIEGLAKSWDNMTELRSDSIIPTECEKCKIKQVCLGGCKADALRTHGSINAKDPICDPEYKVTEIKQQPLTKITKKEIFKINPQLKFRKEEFGGILFVNTSNYVLADQSLYGLITGGMLEITIEKLMQILRATKEEALETASELIKKRILG